MSSSTASSQSSTVPQDLGSSTGVSWDDPVFGAAAERETRDRDTARDDTSENRMFVDVAEGRRRGLERKGRVRARLHRIRELLGEAPWRCRKSR